MTIPHPTEAPALLTDADMLARVRQLVGTAVTDRQLWIMFVDRDGRQSPVVVPVSDLPRSPEPDMVHGLTNLLDGMRAELGNGSAILVIERLGPDVVMTTDRAWAGTFAVCCRQAGLGLRGVFLRTCTDVRLLR